MKFFAAFLALAVMAIILATPVFASEVGLEVKERATGNDYGTLTNPIEVCTGPITIREVLTKVSNIGPSTDTYKVTFQNLPDGWTGEIQSDVMLASGESKVLDLFVINNYYAEPGTYSFTIRAESLNDKSDFATKTMKVDILPCFSTELSSSQISKSVCAETGAVVGYTISVRNTGKYKDTFDIGVPQIAKTDKTSLTIEPDQSASFNVNVTSSGLQGVQSIPIIVKSETTQQSSNITLDLDVKDCYSSDVSIEPQSQAGCIGRTSKFTLTIKNTGNPDNYQITLPSWASADATSFALANGETRQVNINANVQSQGKTTLDVSITSGDKPSTKKISAEIDATDCRDISVIASPGGSTVCRGDISVYDVTVKNKGPSEDTITLSSSSGSFSLNKVVLASGASQTVKLNVDSSRLTTGNNTVEVTATDGKVSDKAAVGLNVDECFASVINITPESNSVCPLESFNYTITLKNIGKNDDTFVVKFKDLTENAALAAGQSVSWDIPAYSDQTGAYALTATATSNHSLSNATATLIVQPANKCFKAELTADSTAKATANVASTIIIKVSNTGTITDSYTASVEGPNWVYVSPEAFSVKPGEQANIYLYMSPKTVDDNTSANIMVTVKSATVTKSVNVTVLVGNATGLEPGFGIGGITGAILFEGDRPLWKVIVVAIIALAIVIILVVRFALLVKN